MCQRGGAIFSTFPNKWFQKALMLMAIPDPVVTGEELFLSTANSVDDLPSVVSFALFDGDSADI